jgi:arsenical pump membrane protein
MVHSALGILIFGLTLGAIMVRPYHISEAFAAAIGAVLMVLGRFLPPNEALRTLAGEWNIFGFFLGLMVISSVADQAGLFEFLAAQTGRLAKGSARRLFLGVFLVGALTTAFLSNDATALILTPAVYTLVTRLRLPVLPFMFACTFIADTASFLFPISNPINILFFNSLGSGLAVFLHYLLLPALFCMIINFSLFSFLFRHDLRRSYDVDSIPLEFSFDRAFFRFTVITLSVISIAYVLASAFQLPLSFVAMGGAIFLLIGSRRFVNWPRLRREISWSLFIFISGMFIVIKAIENLGFVSKFGFGLVNLARNSPAMAILITSMGTALGANLINNVPMALVMISALSSVGADGPVHQSLVYASILGCDLGPNLTTIGSLATMLWLLILRRKGLEISYIEYFKLGVVVVPVMVAVGALLIWLHW